MRASLPPGQVPALNWVEVGELPAAIREGHARSARMGRSWWGAILGGVAGGIVGYLALILWTGSGSWWLEAKVELFLAVAVPVGLAEFFFNRHMQTVLQKALQLHVKRIAISDGRLYLDREGAPTTAWPLNDVRVGTSTLVNGWSVIARPAGRYVQSFEVPATLGVMIDNAKITQDPSSPGSA